MASGFLATLVVKFAVANYGLSLMALADPFAVCAGEFLWVPTDLGMEIKTEQGAIETFKFLEAFDERGRALPTEMLEKWFNSKRRALVHIALSRTVLWGFLVHLCMFNLFVTVQEEIGDVTSIGMILRHRDTVVVSVCLGFTCLVVVFGCKAIRALQKWPVEQGDTSDESDDNASTSGKDKGHDRSSKSQITTFTGEVESRT